MKGIVFTEFLEMVEARFSPSVADHIIAAADLPSRGAYTAVGTYDHSELIHLVTHLSTETGIAGPDLVRTFGTHLFGRFTTSYPHLFDGIGSVFSFLERLDDYIHVEVRKLYPDAELPQFAFAIEDPHSLTLTYRSTRPFADFAEGLLIGCIAHFGEPIDLYREDLAGEPGTAARFSLTRRG
jgi:Haem-NO-binding